jgi:LCP family protein required for cell wall assembly
MSLRRRLGPTGKALVGLAVCMSLLGLAAVGTLVYAQVRLDHQVHRMDVFSGLQGRPSKPGTGPGADALNILVLGSDQRPGAQLQQPATTAWEPGSQRSDTVMVLHVAADRRGASVISLPRDAWVDVPGHGHAKLNAAFSWGGPRLALQTVERLTGTRMDHVAWIGWDGFRQLTDTLGGVHVWVPRTVHDSARGVTWTRGEHRLDGRSALLYVRERYGLPAGDLDRMQRQQNFLRGLMDQTRHEFKPTHPRTMYAILDAISRNITVDQGFTAGEMRGLVFTLSGLRSDQVDFLSAPVAGLGREGDQSVVHLDATAGGDLWRAVRADRVSAWVAAHPEARTPAVVD